MNLLARTVRLALLLAVVASVGRPALASGISKGPYLMDVTPTSVTVCWVSDADAEGTVGVRETGAAAASADDWKHVAKETKAATYHRVKLAGLKPHTRYTYQVECAGRLGHGTFATAARPDDPFQFVAYGDNRTQANVHAAVVARITRFEPAFVVNTGDQVANGADEGMWAQFFEVAAPMLRDAPYYPSLGNHEGEASPYFRYFGPARYYSFDYGNAHFVCLDTNLTGAEWSAEEKWLQRDLATHQTATWRVVYMHHPVHTCTIVSGRREGAAQLRARIEPLLVKYHVQLVVSGHDHNYQRHEAQGITYLISGGGGAPLYDLVADTPYVRVAKKAYHDCEIKVDGPTLTCNVVTPDGTSLDEFTLHAR